MYDLFERYCLELRKTALDQKTEHTDRAALERLLQDLAERLCRGRGLPILVQHEPRRVAGKGAPDFKVTRAGAILGYVENKQIGENLDQVLKSDQIAKYKSLSGNILLTDYLHWIWLKDGRVQARESLCFPHDLENPRFKPDPERVRVVAGLIEGFFSQAPVGLNQAKPLAEALAVRAHLLRDHLAEELIRQERDHREGRLFGLFEVFRNHVFKELTTAEFADAFAQMLGYGLFLARLNANAEPVTLANAREYVPGSFRLIRELVEFLTELDRPEYAAIRWVVEEILSIVNGLDLSAINRDLSFNNRKAIGQKVKGEDEEEHRLFERDPFVYFYEDFLAKYDAKLRKARGVYYTPPPIVNFIVRAVDDILKDMFGIPDGLADHKRVTVLDFACGTGTFLLEVLERIFENIGGAASGKASAVVREHILKNVFGFEYLIAPYTIAHLKLSQFLKDKEHALREQERLQVFLTNTLEPIVPQKNFLLPALSDEAEKAQAVKDRPILAIVGNPPYSGHSKNKGAWITAAIDGYKFVVEKDAQGREHRRPLGEKNPKWLNDDYVKFIRFAQLKMDAVDEGIVGIITNHSWLDNPTFRGMRQSLLRSFDRIYVIDLHGNAKKKERAPDGSDDQNVFDIEQGVAISLFVKKKGLSKGVWRADWWGSRIGKYQAAAQEEMRTVAWEPIQPSGSFLTFTASDDEKRAEYESGWPVTEILPVNVLGFQTHRDGFAIAFDREEIVARVKAFLDPSRSDQDLERHYGLSSNRDWSVAKGRQLLKTDPNWASRIMQSAYRPFDTRWCLLGYDFMDYPRREFLDHVAGRDNVLLCVGRAGGAIPERPWELVTVASMPVDANGFRRGGISCFPLYLYPPQEGSRRRTDLFGEDDLFAGRERIENIAPRFRKWLDDKYAYRFTAEEVFGFIYAVLHAPAYRRAYEEFLRIDFPRIAFPEKGEHFQALSALGWDLAQKHLLKDVPRLGLGRFTGRGNDTVETSRYVPAEQAVHINGTQFFAPIPEEVWNFHIGGFQVLDKYLKSRKGRVLSLDEIANVESVTNILAFTVSRMAEIDEVFRHAFPTSAQ